MKTLAALILIICVGCRATDPITGKKKTANRTMITVTGTIPTMTRDELTAAHVRDSIRLDKLEQGVVYLDTTQWKVDSSGNLRQHGRFEMDSIVARKWLFVGVPKDTIPNTDTIHDHPHDPPDTIPVVPKIRQL